MDAVDINTQEITAGEPRVNQPPPDISQYHSIQSGSN